MYKVSKKACALQYQHFWALKETVYTFLEVTLNIICICEQRIESILLKQPMLKSFQYMLFMDITDWLTPVFSSSMQFWLSVWDCILISLLSNISKLFSKMSILFLLKAMPKCPFNYWILKQTFWCIKLWFCHSNKKKSLLKNRILKFYVIWCKITILNIILKLIKLLKMGLYVQFSENATHLN